MLLGLAVVLIVSLAITYQDEINAKKGSKFNMPVVYYSQLIDVAYGRNAKDSSLDGQIIPVKKLEDIAGK